MKYTLLLFVLLCAACDQKDSAEAILQEVSLSSLRGSWQLAASSYSIGDGQQHWRNEENGYYYHFSLDNTFTSTQYEDQGCSGSTFTLKGDTLTLQFNCANGQSKTDSHIAEIINDQLVLYPQQPRCIEGCSYKFIRRPELH